MSVLNEKQFWTCISILLRNYHALNKKIFASVISEVLKVEAGIALCKGYAKDVTAETTCKTSAETEMFEILAKANTSESNCEGFIIKYKFLTRKSADNIKATGVVDFTANSYSCYFECNNFEGFRISLSAKELLVENLTQRLDVEVSNRWTQYVLKPKLLKWCHSTTTAKEQQVCSSLQLVDKEVYNNLYKELKIKYAEKALKFWHDAAESTDPLKFIYEDLAIAAYLIALWQSTNSTPNAFADLGCGNGLLVYILHEEGFSGYGYDVRARKLWAHYPANTRKQLLEQVIEPQRCQLPPEVDWLIGNHSDELSPWLPVLAATASHQMRYFLLPCCAYELSGAKFQRRNTKISVYQDFYGYAKQISQKCGYVTLQDRLKIPSTKRLALIGIERLHAELEFASRKHEINEFVALERRQYANNLTETEVKLREKQELVRNCTQIDKSIIEGLVAQIFALLLGSKNTAEQLSLPNWRAGGRLSMREIAQSLSQQDLKAIKAECGGIKTLLRNKHEIFEFCGNDMIGIRRPVAGTLTKGKPQTVKKRLCFFKQQHPDGCPLSDAECTFIH